MEYFTEIPDAQAIIRQKGYHQQVALYRRGRKVYAKIGNRFVRLQLGSATSVPHISWIEADLGEAEMVKEGAELLIKSADVRAFSA